ncbi:MAG: hydantoinase/oxoprolinase family protein [Acidimicrobiales bacterium]
MNDDFTIAVDIGGTFTDLIGYEARTGRFVHAKSLTTPEDLVEGVLACIARSGADVAEATDVVHGSTIAINTVLEAKGARTGLVVTLGTRDVYSIGRGNRPDAYNLFFRRPRPLVPRALTFEVSERILASGEVATPLDEDSVVDACAALRAADVQAVAVCFLHSYANPDHERRAGAIIRAELPDLYVSLSHEILRQYREYERTSTTVVNSYVGPVVSRYVESLELRLRERGLDGDVWIMQSGGGVMTPATAARRPVSMMESGPVGGIIAANEVGRELGHKNVIAFDMGGTTAKVSLIRDSTPTITDVYYVGGYAEGHPVLGPVVDVVEVGTGGGSIAWIDEVGALKVGPRSAGADPGPICYRRGGLDPTVTDANVALGRIRPSAFMGGEMGLDIEGALAGIAKQVAEPLGLDPLAAAHGIIEVANAKMALAVREVSVAKGHDPRDFVLLASGGAGPLHAAAIARELDIPRVIVPRYPGHFSAVGMLLTDERHDLVQTIYARLDRLDPSRLQAAYREMVDRLTGLIGAERLRVESFLDMRYAGQDFTLPVPIAEHELSADSLEAIRRRFDEVHQRRYGHHAADEHVDVVNLRVTGFGRRDKPRLSGIANSSGGAEPTDRAPVRFERADEAIDAPIYVRDHLGPGDRIQGPALIEEYASTTIVFAGDIATVADNLELEIDLRRKAR